MINTTLSNQLFRRREYSVLRSIGLTEKQLYKVIICEGMCYSILCICVTLLMGTPIAILICRQMSIGCYGKVVEYSFPFFYMSIYVFVLLLIQVILSIYQIREQKKKSTKNGIIIQIERKKCNLYIKYGNEILKYYTYVIKKILTGRRKVG